MKRRILILMVTTLALFVILNGCQKKTTKTEPEPVPQVEQPETTADEGVAKQDSMKEEKAVAEEKTPSIDLSFQKVYFEFDKYALDETARNALSHNAKVLKAYPDVKLLIEGHCDERGTIEYNLALGEKRANAVKNYLVNYGVKGSRLSTISYGEEKPVDPRSTEAAWAKNRRAEFTITQR